MTRCFAGLDWAARDHAVCVIGESGAIRDRFDVTHDAVGLREVLARLRRCAPAPEQLPVAIEHTVSALPNGPIIMSLPRAGQVCAAQILAELGEVRGRFPSDAQLAAEAGVPPLSYESSKHRALAFRWACNHRLRSAITCFADNSRHASPWADPVYVAARGCDHPHAIRILARAWIRVLWRMWVDRRTYDPARHRTALALNAARG